MWIDVYVTLKEAALAEQMVVELRMRAAAAAEEADFVAAGVFVIFVRVIPLQLYGAYEAVVLQRL